MPKPKRGGRKAANRLPNHKRAAFPKGKLKNYLLNPTKEPNKSKVLAELGYNMKNADRLEADIRKGLKNNKATLFEPNQYGTPAQVVMELGITKKREMRTAWMFDHGSDVPRFVTAYPD
jgi:hypothetical protein